MVKIRIIILVNCYLHKSTKDVITVESLNTDYQIADKRINPRVNGESIKQRNKYIPNLIGQKE